MLTDRMVESLTCMEQIVEESWDRFKRGDREEAALLMAEAQTRVMMSVAAVLAVLADEVKRK